MHLTVDLDIADALVLRSEIDKSLDRIDKDLAALRDKPFESKERKPTSDERELMRRRAVLAKIQKEL